MRVLIEIALASAVLWITPFARDRALLPSLRVLVNNAAATPAATVRHAELECSRIFREAGIEINWISPEPFQPHDLLVTITALREETAPGVLGYVVETPCDSSAFVIWSRVSQWIAPDRPAYQIMGRVMAHEIGHLLLPDVPHSHRGLMRGAWSPDDFRASATGSFFFTPEQQLQIHRELARRIDEFSENAASPKTAMNPPPARTAPQRALRVELPTAPPR